MDVVLDILSLSMLLLGCIQFFVKIEDKSLSIKIPLKIEIRQKVIIFVLAIAIASVCIFVRKIGHSNDSGTEEKPPSAFVSVSFIADDETIFTRTFDASSAYGVLPTPQTREGYDFDGWYDNPNSAGNRITSSTRVISDYDHRLYARWLPWNITVSFDARGGSARSPMIVEFGSPYGNDANERSLGASFRPGYRFDGWYISQDDVWTKVTNTTGVSLSVDHRLVAKWTQGETVTVTLLSGLGTTYTTLSLIPGAPYGDMGTARRAGYLFDGWFTISGDRITDSTGVADSSAVPNADHALEARWIKGETVTVTLLSGIGTTYTTLRLIPGIPYGDIGTAARAGYLFDGWFTISGDRITDSTGVADSSIVPNEDHTLEARWVQNATVTVTYLSKPDGNALGTKTAAVGHPYGSLMIAERAGYAFDGWETVSGVLITSSSFVVTTTDHDLIARWIEKSEP